MSEDPEQRKKELEQKIENLKQKIVEEAGATA